MLAVAEGGGVQPAGGESASLWRRRRGGRGREESGPAALCTAGAFPIMHQSFGPQAGWGTPAPRGQCLRKLVVGTCGQEANPGPEDSGLTLRVPPWHTVGPHECEPGVKSFQTVSTSTVRTCGWKAWTLLSLLSSWCPPGSFCHGHRPPNTRRASGRWVVYRWAGLSYSPQRGTGESAMGGPRHRRC